VNRFGRHRPREVHHGDTITQEARLSQIVQMLAHLVATRNHARLHSLTVAELAGGNPRMATKVERALADARGRL
jgi:hypothetical protein